MYKTSRQQMRDNVRKEEKMKSKVYTFEELSNVVKVAVLDAQKEYDVNYSLCLASALSAPPFRFGRKRVCNVLKLFFDQTEALNSKVITVEQLQQESKRLGVVIKNENNTLSVHLDLKKELFY